MATVEVRRTKRGAELRVDGTLASAILADGKGTGPVWDAIALPVALRPPDAPVSVLLLGLAGGSVVRAAQAFRPDTRFVGVDFDQTVVDAAREHLGLDALGVEIVVGDARDILRSERRRFDLLIEDLFVGPSSAVRKPDWLLGEGIPLAHKRLAPGGLYVTNTIHEGPAMRRALLSNFPHLTEISVRCYWNRIYVASEEPLDSRTIRRTAQRHPALAGALGYMSFRRLR